MATETSALWSRLSEEIERFPEHLRQLPVVTRATPREIRDELERRFPFDRPVPLSEAAETVVGLLRRWNVQVTHPCYFGLFNPSVRQAGVVGDTLAALFNPQLAVWSHAPAAQEIERHTLARLGALVGFGPGGVQANFTTGGAEANLSAIVAALARRFPEWSEGGVAALPARPAIYVSAEGHHSFTKIVRMVGLGTGALHEVPTSDRFTLDPAALRERLRADARDGWCPLVVVGTAGTTSAGMVDPLPALADAAREHGAWFHVDAAWGGAAALSPRLAPVLTGIERADSLTWDAHKWLSVPMGAGMFFCRHPEATARAFAVATSYMPGRSGSGTADPYATTAQWSRRAIGLKVFLSLAELGLDGYRELIEHQAAMGDRLRERLIGAGWAVVNDTPLPTVCFTHPEIRSGRVTTRKILGRIYRRGRVWISDVTLGGRERVLRATVTSFLTRPEDVETLVEEVERARRADKGGEDSEGDGEREP